MSTDLCDDASRPTRLVHVSLLIVGLLAVGAIALTGSAVAATDSGITAQPTTFADEDASGSGSASVNTTRRNVSKTTVAPGGTTTIEVFVDKQGTLGTTELVEVVDTFSPAFESVSDINYSRPQPGASGPGPNNQVYDAFWNENANNYTVAYDVTIPTSASAGDTFDITGNATIGNDTVTLPSATITVAQQPGFRLDPVSDRVGTQNTTTFELVATGANNGVTSYSANVSTNDTSVASLQSVSLTNQASTDNSTVASDNSWALVEADLSSAHSAANEVVVAELTVDTGQEGTAAFSIANPSLSSSSGDYTIQNILGTNLKVSDAQPNFGLSNVNVPASASNGTTVTVGATVDNTGTASGTETVQVSAGGTTLNSTDVSLSTGASQQVSLSFDAATLGEGNYTVTVSFGGNTATSQLEITQAGVKLPGTQGPARSVDSDPLLEDVDGSGTADVFDAIELYNQLNTPELQNNPQFFDFDGSGSIDVFDAIELFNKIQSL